MRLRQRLISAALRAITKPRQAAFHIPIGSPIEFERFCADALAAAGWQSKTTAASGDQGADVVAKKDGRLLVVQCKLYSGTVGTAAVQQAHSACAFYGADHAAVVTNAIYSKGARALERDPFRLNRRTRSRVLILRSSLSNQIGKLIA